MVLVAAFVHATQVQPCKVAIGLAVVHAGVLGAGVVVEPELEEFSAPLQQVLRCRERLRRERPSLGQASQDPALGLRV